MRLDPLLYGEIFIPFTGVVTSHLIALKIFFRAPL